MDMRRLRTAPSRMLTSMALWWLGPLPPLKTTFDPPPVELPKCSLCGKRAAVYRKYADDHIECLDCWPKGRG